MAASNNSGERSASVETSVTAGATSSRGTVSGICITDAGDTMDSSIDTDEAAACSVDGFV